MKSFTFGQCASLIRKSLFQYAASWFKVSCAVKFRSSSSSCCKHMLQHGYRLVFRVSSLEKKAKHILQCGHSWFRISLLWHQCHSHENPSCNVGSLLVRYLTPFHVQRLLLLKGMETCTTVWLNSKRVPIWFLCVGGYVCVCVYTQIEMSKTHAKAVHSNRAPL